jgi:IS5 family transposase
MRPFPTRQRTLSMEAVGIPMEKVWNKIGEILEECPTILVLVFTDLTTRPDGTPKKNTGKRGMDAGAVLRFAIVKMMLDLDYRDLRDRVADSIVLRNFCQIPFGVIPAHTTLQENIKQLRPATMEQINQVIVKYAVEKGIEDGKQARLDTTAVESNIHHPTDASLLWDVIRVATRILDGCQIQFPELSKLFQNHYRAAKRLLFKINNARGKTDVKALHRRLIKLARKAVGYLQTALARLPLCEVRTMEQIGLRDELIAAIRELLSMAGTTIEQARRRVLNGEEVPASEKLVSIFEPHTDILVKGKRDVIFGHKVLLAVGKSSIILDCAIFRGNPADSGEFLPALERLKIVLGGVPANAATDGGFASKENAQQAQAMGVKNVAFSSPKGSKIVQAITGTRVYKRLCKWRAGIEGIISATKRSFGLDRCTWSGFESFQVYVQCGVLAFNLMQIAHHMLI